MRRFLLAALMMCAAWSAAPAQADTEDCAWPLDIRAMEAIRSAESWTALREFRREFHMCDDRFLAVTIGETVIDLLEQDSPDLEMLNDLVAADDSLRTFILRHIDGFALPSELRRMVENLRRCPGSAARLCEDIEERAERAMRTPPWGDGPHRCNSEMAYRVEGIAGLSASWSAFHEIYEIYHVCDDGAIAAGFSGSVVKLLGEGGGSLAEVGNLVRRDTAFRTFIFRHISGYSTRGELEPVIASTRECPSGLESLCDDIRVAAEAAIVENESY